MSQNGKKMDDLRMRMALECMCIAGKCGDQRASTGRVLQEMDSEHSPRARTEWMGAQLSGRISGGCVCRAVECGGHHDSAVQFRAFSCPSVVRRCLPVGQ